MATSKPGKKQSTDSVRKTKPTKKQIAEVIEKTKTKAEEFARDPIKAKKLLEDAVKKMKGYESNRGPSRGLGLPDGLFSPVEGLYSQRLS